MNHQPRGHGRHRIGRWLPHQDALEDWLEGLVTEVRDKAGKVTLHPVIAEFAELIDDDPIVRMYVTQMIEQVPDAKQYSKRHLVSVDQMLRLINEVIGRAPEYNETGLVGTPLNAVLDWCMGTPAGFAAFRHPPINAMLCKILNVWREFLSSPASLYVLNDTPRGWKCASAKKATRIEEFQYKPREKQWGFTSWNDYFTRQFKPGARPIADPGNDKVIVSACESTPYALKTNVRRRDRSGSRASPIRCATCWETTPWSNRSLAERSTRHSSTPQLSSLAQSGDRHDSPGIRPARDILFGGRVRRGRPRGTQSIAGLYRARGHAGDHLDRGRRSRDRPGVLDARRNGRGLFVRDSPGNPAGPPREERRRSRLLPVRRLDLLPDFPARCHRGVRRGRTPAAR